MFSPGIGLATTADSGPIDVHLVTHEEVGHGRPSWRSFETLDRRRRLAGFGVAAIGLPLITLVLANARHDLSLPSDMLLYLAVVIAVALVGGLYPALVAAVVASLLLNYYFTPPLYRFTIAEHENLLALVVFLIVGVVVALTVDLAARRTREAALAQTEAATLSMLAGSVLRGSRPLPALLEQLRETFGFTSVTLLERLTGAAVGPDLQQDPACWTVVASVGGPPVRTPSDGDAEVAVDEVSLVLCGHPLEAHDRRVVEAFAAQAAVALRQERLTEAAAAAGTLSEVDQLRTALLSAVSHDLRTPLASAKAATSGLLSSDVVLTPEARGELLSTVDESLDRLARLVENLLDMSRLQAGVLGVTVQPLSLADAASAALDDLGPAGQEVDLHIPGDIPEVRGDPALVERVLVNVLANAVRYSPPGSPPLVTVSAHGGFVETRVVDHGPGIPTEEWDAVFLPFQRLGDRDNDTGVGLGLALSRGLAEAMGGALVPEDTPGGGLTMTLRLPEADVGAGERPADADDDADPAILDRLDHWHGTSTAPS
jgi:two-component system, OmpR family, sensor histidine kinase KdpD